MSQLEDITDAVLSVLQGRKGFGDWWDDLYGTTKTDIYLELMSAVDSVLKR